MTGTAITILTAAAALFLLALLEHRRNVGKVPDYRASLDKYLKRRLDEALSGSIAVSHSTLRESLMNLVKQRDFKLALYDPTPTGFKRASFFFAGAVLLAPTLA